jgi:hypothetical protein
MEIRMTFYLNALALHPEILNFTETIFNEKSELKKYFL